MTVSAPPTGSHRELRIAGEIAQAFLTARHPTEVYRLALERVGPLVGASFACIFLRDEDPELLRIEAAYNWPQRYASYLGSMRVRIGNGPTGRAVLENELVDVLDVFSDPELEDWWESARELGFTSAISLPLSFEARPVGSLTFYFRNQSSFLEADRELLRLVANQLAATAERAHLVEDLEKANEQLRKQNGELEERYREAEEARRLKNEFLANVSHELRTPLTAILGYTFLLREGVHGELKPEQSTAIARIDGAGNQLLTLIEGLLEVTRLKLGRIDSEPELCDAAVLAREAIVCIQPNDSVELRAEIPDGRIPIHTDPSLVNRVLNSLLSNAMKFTRQGSVTLRLRTEAPAANGNSGESARSPLVLWEVEDTGIGIEEADFEYIFDEFRQVDGSATRKFGGAGLGLAVARGIARRLGGDIHVSSTVGQGTCFTFSLPSAVVRAGS